MKYKVWKQASAILKPPPQHRATIGLFVFLGLLLVSVVVIVRLAVIYAGNFYDGVREPYVQMLASNSVNIRWQTETPVQAAIRFGTSTKQLDKVASVPARKSEHEISLTGLQSATKYYYQLEADQRIYRQGKQYWFVTAPSATDIAQVRFVVFGDQGHATDGIREVRSGLQVWLDANRRHGRELLDFIISTGDNAAPNGSNDNFQVSFFDVLADDLKNYMLWPAYGNHDARRWAFYRIFSLPQQAESGGLASGTERYYSVDYGPLHIVFLDSVNGAYEANDDMLQWLEADLKNTNKKWLMAVMHHPPYSRGSHNSNDAKDSDYRMFNVRNRIVPILEKAGVDVVLSGHSHSYERSHLIDCHYDLSSSFDEKMLVQRGHQFTKPEQRAPHQGSVYVVHGASSFLVDKGPLNHPVMATSLLKLGSMVFDISANKLAAVYIDDEGNVADEFVIEKNKDKQVDNNQMKSCH